MNKSFWDKHQFLHDKESADSNNPLIYSAFWRALTGEQIDYNDTYFKYMVTHKTMGNDITIKRTPTNNEATSLDEIIGAISLSLLDDKFLSLYSYKWHDTIYAPSKFRIFQAAVYCIGKHRNFFKDANVIDLHPVSYWIPWHVQYYAVKKSDSRKFTPMLSIMFYLWVVSVLIKKNHTTGANKVQSKNTGAISQKNILFLTLSDLKSKYLIRLIDYKSNFNAYFESENHPIRKYINGK